jgi:opacity protein-like surface antigen
MRFHFYSAMTLALSLNYAQADILPEGLNLRLSLGGSYAQPLKIMDRSFALNGLISGDPNDLTPGQLNNTSTSPLFGGGVDYRVLDGLRIGAELLYRNKLILTDHDGHPANALLDDPGGLTSAKGNISAFSYMATVAYDLPLPLETVKLFVTGGIGGAMITTQNLQMQYLGQNSVMAGQSSSHFAYDVGAGFSFPITEETTLEFGYYYASLGDLLYPAQTVNGGGIPVTSSGFKGKLTSNEALANLRWHF